MAWPGGMQDLHGDMCRIIRGVTMVLKKKNYYNLEVGFLIGQRHMRVFWVLERAVPTRRFFRVLTTYAQGKISIWDDVARGHSERYSVALLLQVTMTWILVQGCM